MANENSKILGTEPQLVITDWVGVSSNKQKAVAEKSLLKQQTVQATGTNKQSELAPAPITARTSIDLPAELRQRESDAITASGGLQIQDDPLTAAFNVLSQNKTTSPAAPITSEQAPMTLQEQFEAKYGMTTRDWEQQQKAKADAELRKVQDARWQDELARREAAKVEAALKLDELGRAEANRGIDDILDTSLAEVQLERAADSRTTTEAVTDTVKDVAGKGAVNTGQVAWGLGTGVIDGTVRAAQLLGDAELVKNTQNLTGFDIVGGDDLTVNKGLETLGKKTIGVSLAPKFGEAKDIIEEAVGSDAAGASKKLADIAAKERSATVAADYLQAVSKKGKLDFSDKAAAQTASFIQAIGDTVDNPIELQALVGETLVSSFVPGAIVAGRMKGLSAEFLASEAGKKQVAEMASSTGMTVGALQEGLSNAVDAQERIDNMSDKELFGTVEAARLLEQGLTKEQARQTLRSRAFAESGVISALVSIVSTKATNTGKMEGTNYGTLDIGEAKGSVLEQAKGIATGTGKEFIQESLESGGGQVGQNSATAVTTNPDQELSSGVGDAAAKGGLAGGITAGTMSTAKDGLGIAVGTVSAVAKTVNSVVSSTAKAVTEKVEEDAFQRHAKDNPELYNALRNGIKSGDFTAAIDDATTPIDKLAAVLSPVILQSDEARANNFKKVGDLARQFIKAAAAEGKADLDMYTAIVDNPDSTPEQVAAAKAEIDFINNKYMGALLSYSDQVKVLEAATEEYDKDVVKNLITALNDVGTSGLDKGSLDELYRKLGSQAADLTEEDIQDLPAEEQEYVRTIGIAYGKDTAEVQGDLLQGQAGDGVNVSSRVRSVYDKLKSVVEATKSGDASYVKNAYNSLKQLSDRNQQLLASYRSYKTPTDKQLAVLINLEAEEQVFKKVMAAADRLTGRSTPVAATAAPASTPVAPPAAPTPTVGTEPSASVSSDPVLSEPVVETPKAKAPKEPPVAGGIKFVEHSEKGYAPRTKENAKADVTIAFAADHTTAGEKATQTAVKRNQKTLVPLDLNGSTEVSQQDVDAIVDALNASNATSINIAGNGIYTLSKVEKGYTQEALDTYVYEVLKAVLESPRLTAQITKLVSGGQTGVDESGAKAGAKLGLDTTIVAPKGFKMRGADGKDVYGKRDFMARFEQKLTAEEKAAAFDKEMASEHYVERKTKDMAEELAEEEVYMPKDPVAKSSIDSLIRYFKERVADKFTTATFRATLAEYKAGALAAVNGEPSPTTKMGKAGYRFGMTHSATRRVFGGVTMYLAKQGSKYDVKFKKNLTSFSKYPNLVSRIMAELYSEDEVNDHALLNRLGFNEEDDMESLFQVVKFLRNFEKQLNETISLSHINDDGVEVTTDNRINQNPLAAYVEEVDGKIRINENVASAIGYAALQELLTNKSLTTTMNTNKVINGILGDENKDEAPSSSQIALLRNAGTPLTMVATSIGQTAMGMLGTTINHPKNKLVKNAAPTAFGQAAMAVLVKMGMFEYQTISAGDLIAVNGGNGISFNSTLNRKDPVYFVKVIRDPSEKSAYSKTMAVALAFDEAAETMEKLFGENPDVVKPLVNAKPVKATSKITRNSKTMPESMIPNLQRQNEQPHVISKLGSLFNLLPESVQINLTTGNYGTKYEQSHISLKGEIDAAVEASERDLRDFNTLASRRLKRFYLATESYGNRRMGHKTRINPQQSKIHRWLVSNETWKQKVSMENLGYFRHAVVLAFDGKIDVWQPAKVKAEFERIYAHPAVQAAVREIERMERGEQVDGQALLDLNAMKEFGGGKLHLVAGVVALNQYRKAKASGATEFESDLAIEVDGKTNGFAFSLIQYAGMTNEVFELLNRTGVLTGYNSLADYMDAGNTDSYQLIAKTMGDIVDSYVDANSEKYYSKEDMPAMNALINREIWSHKKKLERGEKVTPLANYVMNQLAGNKNKTIFALQSIVGSMVDSNGKVTKQGRDYAKPPLMTWNYNAGKYSISRGFADSAIEVIYKKLAEMGHNEQAEAEYQEYKAKLEVIFGTKITATRVEAIGFTFNENEVAYFVELINSTYGTALNSAMTKAFPVLDAQRKTIRDITGNTLKVFSFIYTEMVKRELAKPENEHLSLPTEDIKDAVLEQLKWMAPQIAGFNSTEGNWGEVTDNIARMKFTESAAEGETTLGRADSDNRYVEVETDSPQMDKYTNTTGSKTVTKVAKSRKSMLGLSDTRLEFKKGQELNVTTILGAESKPKSQMINPSLEAPLYLLGKLNTSFAPILVHNLDGAVINIMMGIMNGYNLNDAIMIHPNDAQDVITKMNEAFKQVNEQYSIPQAAIDMATTFFKKVEEFAKDNPGFFDEAVWKTEDFTLTGMNAVNQMANETTEMMAQYRDGRMRVIKAIDTWSQYSLPGAEYRAPVAAPVAQETTDTVEAPVEAPSVSAAPEVLDEAPSIDDILDQEEPALVEEIIEVINEVVEEEMTPEEAGELHNQAVADLSEKAKNTEILSGMPQESFDYYNLGDFGFKYGDRATLGELILAMRAGNAPDWKIEATVNFFANETGINMKTPELIQTSLVVEFSQLIGANKYKAAIPKFQKMMDKGFDERPLLDMLGDIAGMDLGYYSVLARSLQKHLSRFDPDIKVSIEFFGGSRLGGAYYLNSEMILSDNLLRATRGAPTSYPLLLTVILHEAIHFSTNVGIMEDPQLKEDIRDLQYLISQATKDNKTPFNFNLYAVTRPEELLTVALTDPAVIQLFKNTRINRGRNAKPKTLWDAVSAFIHRMLGMERDDTALSLILDLAPKAFKATEEKVKAKRAAKGNLGSSAAPIGVFSNSQSQTFDLNSPDGVIQLMEDLHNNDIAPTTSEHLDFLKDVMRSLGQVMEPVKVLVAKGANVTAGDYDTKTKQARIKLNAMPSAFRRGMSAAETYAHEMLHHFIEPFIDMNNRYTRNLQFLWKLAGEHIKPEDLIELDANGQKVTNPTVEQKEDAQKMWDYIFRNTQMVKVSRVNMITGLSEAFQKHNGFHEFLAHLGTNAQLKAAINNNAALTAAYRAGPRITLEKSNAKSSFIIKGSEFFVDLLNALTDLFVMIGDYYRRGEKGSTAHERAMWNMERMVTINQNHSMSLLGDYLNMEGLDKFARSKLNQAVRSKGFVAAAKALRNNKITQPVGSLMKAASHASRTNKQEISKAFDSMVRAMGASEEGITMHLVREFQGRNEKTRFVHTLRQVSQRFIDNMRNNAKTNMKAFIEQDMFNGELTEQDNKALYNAVLRIDLGYLSEVAGYSISEVERFVTRASARRARMSAIKAELKAEFPTNYAYYYKHAKSLAQYMVTSKHDQYNSGNNAHVIAKMKGAGKAAKYEGNLTRAEALIDELATLQGLELQSTADLQTLSDLFTTNPDAMGNALLMQHKLVKHAFSTTFGGNKMQMKKGYVTDITHPKRSLVFAKAHELTALLASGLELVYDNPIPKDDNDPNGEEMYVLVDPMGALVTLQAGAVSMTSEKHSGTHLVGVRNSNAGANADVTDFIQGKNDFKDYEYNVAQAIAGQFIDDDKIVPENVANPIYDEKGRITEYRYEMMHQTRIDALKLQPRFSDVAGATLAHTKDKINTKVINRIAVDAMKKDFDKYKNTKEISEYVVVGPQSINPKHREMWARLPYDMRQYALQVFGAGGMYIRSRNVADLLGQRELRASGITEAIAKRFNNKFTESMNKLAHNSKFRMYEDVMFEIVAMAKDIVVVKSGINAMLNITSNALLLTLKTGNILNTKYMAEGFRHTAEYMKLSHQVEQLALKLSMTTMTPAERTKVLSEKLRLEQIVQNNPIDFLIRQGVLQTVVEDLAEENELFSYSSELTEKLEKFTNKVPPILMDLAKIGLVTHDTKLYKFMFKAVQMGDFVARYALYEANKAKGMADQANVDDIMETFVDYDYVTHPLIGYLNKIGVMVFTKYMIRMQKVLIKLAIEKPLSVLALAMGQGTFGDVADPYDIWISIQNFINRLSNPIGIVTGAFGDTVTMEAVM